MQIIAAYFKGFTGFLPAVIAITLECQSRASLAFTAQCLRPIEFVVFGKDSNLNLSSYIGVGFRTGRAITALDNVIFPLGAIDDQGEVPGMIDG